jgi:hypothetical protein
VEGNYHDCLTSRMPGPSRVVRRGIGEVLGVRWGRDTGGSMGDTADEAGRMSRRDPGCLDSSDHRRSGDTARKGRRHDP